MGHSGTDLAGSGRSGSRGVAAKPEGGAWSQRGDRDPGPLKPPSNQRLNKAPNT